MKKNILFYVIIATVLYSCTFPKEARLLKKTNENWKEYTVVLEGYADSPFSGLFLTLRENYTFEKKSSGVFRSYEAGTWSLSEDTIHLNYLNQQQKVIKKQTIIMNRENSKLEFEGLDSNIQMRFTSSL